MAIQLQEAATTAARTPTVTKHTVRVRRQQALAKGLIWAAAAIAMGILVLIVGYIVFNGFYERDERDFPVTPYTQGAVTLDNGAEMSVVVPRNMRLRDLTYQSLRELFTEELTFLGFLTEQNRNARTVIFDDREFFAAAERYLLPSGDGFDTYAAEHDRLGLEQIEGALREDDGTIALVPAQLAAQIDGGKLIDVRQATVVVNPNVLALQAGRRLNRLSETQVRGLLQGDVAAWSGVGGPSVEMEPANLAENDPGVYEPLPPVPVVFRSAEQPWAMTREAFELGDEDLAATTVYVESLEEFARRVTSTPGAIGVLRAREALELGLTTAPVTHVSHWLNLRPAHFLEAPSRAGAVGGLSTIIINTVVFVLAVIAIAGPIGIAAAVYLVEYAKQGPLLNLLRLGTDTLSGIPSIIFGLFGLVFFSQFLGFQTGLISGTLTVTLMILPTIIRTSEEALKAVPDSIRHGSLALGATKLQTIFRVTLPSASPGILTGIILGIGRAVGETAAVLYTLGSNLALIRSLNSPIRVLTIHLYLLIRENVSISNAFAAATILVVIVFLVNFATTRLIGRLNRAVQQEG
mgnify:CR=1 FL=1